MKKVSMALLALATALATAPAAMADTFYYNFYVEGIQGSGTLQGTAIETIGTTTVYDITSGTINVSYGGGGYVTGTLDPNSNAPGTSGTPYGGTFNDLLYFPSGDPNQNNLFLDVQGLAFTVFGQYAYTGIWGGDNNGNGAFYSASSGWDAYGSASKSGAFNVSTTPEPSSLILLGTGLLGLAFLVFRKAKPAKSAELLLTA